MTDKCLRCGQCCYLPNGEPCPHLNLDTKLCKIYKKRLGRLVGFCNGIPYFCVMREDIKINYPGCPYNEL